jgi:hypothetical protein
VPYLVVVAEVVAGLDSYQGDGQATEVLNPVALAERDMGGLTLTHEAGEDANGHFGGAFDHDPVFGPVHMGLQRRRLARGEL